MTHSTYIQLIDQTILYLQNLLPKKEAPLTLEKPIPPSPFPPPIKPLKNPEPTSPLPPPPVKKEAASPISLHPPLPPSSSGSSRIEKILKGIDPTLPLYSCPPSDEKAKRIKGSWKEKSLIPEIPILFHGPYFRPFLHNLAKAISLYFSPSKVVDLTLFEKEKKWEIFLASPQLKFILCPDALLFSSSQLLTFYRENPGQQTRFLGDIPLLLLPDLSFYYKDPYLKRSLWNVICQALG
jgi:hypothetical protein